MTKSNKKTASALLTIAAIGCVFGGAVTLSTATVNAETVTPVYGYNALFQEDFADAQLKEGWEYVTGAYITDGAALWQGTAEPLYAPKGKMLYNPQTTEYAVSADLTISTTVTETSTNLCIMPIAVTNPVFNSAGDKATYNNVGQGIGIVFRPTYASLWNYDTGKVVTGTKMSYTKVTGYNANTWFSTAHTITAVVGDYIEVYIDGTYLMKSAAPEAETLYCGVSGTSGLANTYSRIAYDNFTVWTKAESNTATSVAYDMSAILGGETVTGITTKNSDYSTEFEITKSLSAYSNLATDRVVDDFTMNISISSFTRMDTASGIYFRATLNDGTINGYRLALGKGTVKRWRIYKITGESTTDIIDDSNTSISLVTDTYDSLKPITLTANGSTITVTYYKDGNDDKQTTTITDSTYSSGYMGLRAKSETNLLTLTTFVQQLWLEDAATALSKVKLTNTTGEKEYYYCARKDSVITANMLPDDVIGFVDGSNALYASHSVASGDATVLTLDKYAMGAGAALRLPRGSKNGETATQDTISGIRFRAELNQAEYNDLAAYGISVDALGMLVIPTEKFGGDLTLDTSSATGKDAPVVASYGDVYRFYVTLTDIPAANYETDISARGYIVVSYTVGGETVTRTLYTSSTEKRSIKKVAELIRADEEEYNSYTEEAKAKIDEYAGVFSSNEE